MSGDFRDVVASLPKHSDAELATPAPSTESAVESLSVSGAEPLALSDRVRVAEMRFNAARNRMDPDARNALQHSVDYMKEVASGAHDEVWAEQAITALERQLRREMGRRPS
jgi:hypothetical protein